MIKGFFFGGGLSPPLRLETSPLAPRLNNTNERASHAALENCRRWRENLEVGYTCGDSDVVSIHSTPVGFHRHLVGKTLGNVCYCDIA